MKQTGNTASQLEEALFTAADLAREEISLGTP